jgi:hypothetical protein
MKWGIKAKYEKWGLKSQKSIKKEKKNIAQKKCSPGIILHAKALYKTQTQWKKERKKERNASPQKP